MKPKRQLYLDPVERIVAHSVLLPNDCWHWLGSVNNVGRPRIALRVKGKARWVYVTQYILRHVHGETLRRTHRGLHNCDNAMCVNPDHIRRGTQGQNVRDCVARGRHISGFQVPAGYYAGKYLPSLEG